MVLMLTALAACPLATIMLILSEALGWSRAEDAVPYVFATAGACLLAAVIVYMFGVIYG
jgi:hypothetical protein